MRCREGRVGKRALIAIPFVALALSASGQQRANVADVAKKSAAPPPNPVARAVDLPAEPALTPAPAPATLRDAARANDYDAFESLYQRAMQNREPLGAFADLHEVWTHALNDPAGSFFGADVHSKLCSRYPDFAAFIRDYRVRDRNGQPLYPSRETRAFLLAQAIADVDPIVASSRPQAKRVESASNAPSSPGSRQAQPSTTDRVEKTPASQPAGTIRPGTTVEARAAPAASPAALAEARSNTAAPAPRPQQVAQAAVIASDHARGIFLIILVLVAIGVLTMTMQTSSGEIHAIDEDAGHQPAGGARGAESHT